MALPSKEQSPHLRIAVASDLHAFDADEKSSLPSPSHLKITYPMTEPGKHPIAGLIKLIEDESLTADLFLCPGDLGHKAHMAGIQYAWEAVHQLGKKLGSELVVAASGNHDLDSRYLHSEDAKGILVGLVPPYPFPDDQLNNKYWAKNFAITEGASYRLVVLNTSAYHGGKPEEINHGRISESTLAFLRKELSSLSPKPVNIFLCHHHPQQHMELRLGDYDVMKNGQLLLELLGSGEFGRWLIIHGHKHHPKIAYAAGGATSPIVFSAGSLCASLYLELQTMARNQFYLISLPYEDIETMGLVGTIKAWDWASGVGWGSAAGPNSGLPSLSAFGFRGDPQILAGRVAKFVEGDKVSWSHIQDNVQEINYLLPQDKLTLQKELESKYSLRITEENGLPREIGRKF